MPTLTSLISLLAGLAAALAIAAPAATAAEETTLQVEGMYCPACEATVEGLLGDLDGVSEAVADHRSRTATVTYEPSRVTPAEMAKAINGQTPYEASTDGEEAGGSDTAAAGQDPDEAGLEVTAGPGPEATAAQQPGQFLPLPLILGGIVALVALGGGTWLVARRTG